MLKFNEFITEQVDDVLEVDARYVENNQDALNSELDALTEKPYQNAPIFLAQLRGVLQRYGVMLPQELTAQFLNLGAELAYGLGTSSLYLYVVYDTNEDGFVDGYAQVVNSGELSDLMNMDVDDIVNSDREPIIMRPSTWYAKRDDDAGNSDEY